MKFKGLLLPSLALVSLSACFDFEGAYQAYCDGGRCAAAEGDGGGGDGGATDGGGDAGTSDGGCGGAAQLDIVQPAQLVVGVCSATPLKVRVFDACGAPYFPASELPFTLTSSSPTMQLFADDACTFTPGAWSIPAAGEVEVYAQGLTPGMSTLTARSAGVDAGLTALQVGCPGGQRACTNTCVPANGCCEDAECNDGGVAWVCKTTNHRCAPPPCSLPANCGTFDDLTAPSANRTITFGSSGYSPRCIRVGTNQNVTWSGNFFLHPLVQFCGPSDAQLTTTLGTMKTAQLFDFGTYGYRCADHPSFEQGAIRTP